MNNGFEPSSVLVHLGLYYRPFVPRCAVVKPQTQAPGLGPRLLLVKPCFPSPPLACYLYLYLRPIPYQSVRWYLLKHPPVIVGLVSAVQPYLYYISSATIYVYDSVP